MEGFSRQNQNEQMDTNIQQDKIRPLKFSDYIGQEELKDHLSIMIESAKIRKTSLRHILLYGQPGLGKTTLATIIANELGSNIVYTSAPAIEKPADLAGILLNLNDGDILFIDEIHGLKIQTEEMLYPAMEDRLIDIAVPSARENKVLRLQLKNFTLIGATTKPGKISGPLRDRFIHQMQLNYYNNNELKEIIKRTSKILNFKIDEEAAEEIAKRARGTARLANNYLGVAGDYAVVRSDSNITKEIAGIALDILKIDEYGMNQIDRKVINAMYTLYKCKPVGFGSVAKSIQEEVDTVENLVEPYLLQKKFIMKTEKGRVLTETGMEYAKNLVASGFTHN